MKPIPEGYTYTRCDRYTPEEFLEKYGGINLRDICEQYMKDNPKEVYNTDDEIAIHNIHKERAVPGLLHGRNTFTTKKTWYTDR